jgi:hypothetical protein
VAAPFLQWIFGKKIDKPEQEARQRFDQLTLDAKIEMTVPWSLSVALILLSAVGLPCFAAERAFLYEESPNKPRGERHGGSVTWRTEMMPVSPVGPTELTVRCDIVVPKRRITVRWSLRQNTDKSIPASHTIEIEFVLPPDFPEGGVREVLGLSMKQAEQAGSAPLSGLAHKIKPGSFLIGLSDVKTDLLRNMHLLKERNWFDIPIVYDRGRRAILAMEKGVSGQRAFAEAFAVWSKPRDENSREDGIVQPQISKNSASPSGDEAAPFDLPWGASSNQIRALGVELKEAPWADFGQSFFATNIPRTLSDQEFALISFGYDNKLWRIVAMSRSFSNDPSGSLVKRRYKELSATLAEKYGKPIATHLLGDSTYKKSQYFLAGIHGGQSSWYSDYDTPRLTIQLGLTADSPSTGRWRIIYEEKSLSKSFAAARRTREKGGL